RATKEEITKFIAEFIKKMLITASDKAYGDYLLIAGDVSFSFEISKIFYSILSKKWSPKRIIVVLGNHELWDFNLYRASFAHLNLNEIIQNYRDFFNSIGITFLHNDLFISTNMRDLVITESNLKEFPIDKLRKMGQRSSFIVFGGIGFSGLNRTFNASNGIYRNTITSIEDELAQTKNFRDTYNIISNSLGQNKVIVLTHMPKDDWTEQPYNERWIYVNGHTHRNVYFNDIEKTVYSDNQVGYYSKKIGLKYFYTSRQYDIFLLYPNGIYEISRTEYLDFNRGMGIRCQYNRDGRIHMIKNSNLYCFFYQEKGGGRLHMLNGGSIKYVENQSLEYYYENLKTYEIKINSVFSEYFNTLKRISENIKVIGGDGSIHGCIVDIDFFNHLYLNPFDGTLAAYYATSMNNKWKYSGIKGLLLKQRQDLYNNYIKTLSENPHHIEYIADNVYKSSPEEIPEYMSDTGIYKSSRIIRSIQYIFESKVIRSWNDDLLNPNSMLQLIEFD
ncbi:MAG: metallophosphoesterase, partial [Ruminococcus sp.]|nr:metallophosphoesterase [Ruminococcus sp.]